MDVSKLEGAELDAAVALAEGRLVVKDEPGWPKGDYERLREEFGGRHVVRWYANDGELGGWEPLENQGSPSTEWERGGPIIERERIDVSYNGGGSWDAAINVYGQDGWALKWHEGPTPLIAAMRAFVASKKKES